MLFLYKYAIYMRSLYESIFSVPNDPNKAGKNIQDAMGVVFTLQALGVHDNYIDTVNYP